MTHKIYLSRRNLQTLLNKLDRNREDLFTSAATLRKFKNPGKHEQTVDSVDVIAVEDKDYYVDRKPGAVHPLDKPEVKLDFNQVVQSYTHINIWDDYYEDGYVPEGKSQDTYMHIDTIGFSDDEEHCILEAVYKRLKMLKGTYSFELNWYDSRTKYPNLEETYQFARWQIDIKNVTHKEREGLLEVLKTFHPKVEFYSES